MSTVTKPIVLDETAQAIKNSLDVIANKLGDVHISGGKFYGYKASSSALPSSGDDDGYAYVGTAAPYAIYNATSNNGTLSWVDSGSTISNLAVADEEDIDYDANGKLQLANRGTANGKGYMIVRSGIALALQMSQANTIYELRYNFDLNGSTLTMPNNSVLLCRGGVISNGNIAGNNTTILGAEYGAFDNVVLSGSYTNLYSNLSWWGCVPYDANNEFDNSGKIECAISSSFRVIKVTNSYGISTPLDAATKRIEGGDISGWNRCGFVANSNFASKDVTLSRDGNTYTTKAMFYHSFDEHPYFKALFFNCKYIADCAIEHLAGYSNVELDNVLVDNALKVGVLQYACEKMTWDNLYTRNCRIGAVISSAKFNPNNPFVFGEAKGMPNLMVLNSCRFGGGNYGLIIRGGSNYALQNCETYRNSILALSIIATNCKVTNYYSERDSECNFWIYEDGVKRFGTQGGSETDTYSSSGYGYVSPYLLSNNLDGLYGSHCGFLASECYYRSVIYCSGGRIDFDNLFISFSPRSYTRINVPASDVVLPTERNAQGIDSFIMYDNSSNISIKKINEYKHSNGGADARVFAEILDLGTGSLQSRTQCSSNRITVDNNNIRYYATWINCGSNPNNLMVKSLNITSRSDSSPSMKKNFMQIRTPLDLNKDIETERWGNSANLHYLSQKCYKMSYKGVPLYARNPNFQYPGSLYLTKSQCLEKFGDLKQIRYRIIAYFPSACTSYVNVSINAINSSWSSIQSLHYTNQAGIVSVEAGFYEITGIAAIYPKEEFVENEDSTKVWARTHFNVQVYPSNNAEVYVSPLMFYEVEDSKMVIPLLKEIVKKSGYTVQRPYLPPVGHRYYDTNLNEEIIWNGSSWVEEDGEVAGIKRKGTFSERPTPSKVGFQYFCTSGASIDGGTTEKTNIVIYYTGSGWVDANGNAVVAKA